MNRPFWLHQLAEYLLGAVLIAFGVRCPTPALPAIGGVLVAVNTAVVRGPLSAFGLLDRRRHRIADVVVMLVLVAFAVQPFTHVDPIARVVMGAMVLALLVVWANTNFAEKQRRQRPKINAEDGRSTEIGRLAGRAVGDGVNLARRWRDSRKR